MRIGSARFIRRGNTKYHNYFFYISKAVAEDSAFPFGPGEECTIEIFGGEVVITKKDVEKILNRKTTTVSQKIQQDWIG